MNKKLVARNIRKLLKEKDMTQSELALRSGVNRPHLSSICAGRRMPRLTTLGAIARALGTNVKEIIEEKNNE